MSINNEGEKIEMGCAFCHGKGKDPFGLLSEKSTCHVCEGFGKVELDKPIMKCAYCNGTGNYKSYSCNVCKGKGYIRKIKGDTRMCPECYGSGSDIPSGMECLTCHGKGIVRLNKQ